LIAIEPDSAALVLVSHGNRGIVQTADGQEIEAHYRRGVGRPVCGDRVRVEAEERQTAVVSAIEPRRNTFARADGNQRMQTIAANLDHVLIVLAPEPAPSRDLLERYLVAVHSLAIEPVIVINKVERLEEDETRKVGPLSRLAEYEDLGYSVVPTSCKTAPGVEGLRSVLRGHISILVGQSGVGKSSLVNHLVPDLEIQTGALSTSTGKGRHTTTSTMMYSLPVQDGRLIDSPGVWEYGLWELSRAELESGFIEFRPFLGDCRFNNCAHDSEPGCAIKAAVEAGAIKSWRHDSYKRLLAQQQA
jgi:ribosome biogenesis GTPase